MRLLNTITLQLHNFIDDRNRPPYAILSHTWEDGQEVTFAEWTGPQRDLEAVRCKRGAAKILQTCDQARRDGLLWAWIDTCCIDKSSSAELSEAINAMYAWYKESATCYVYLADVYVWPETPESPSADEDSLGAHEPGIAEPNVREVTHIGRSSDGEDAEVAPDWHADFIRSRWFTRGWTLQELIAPSSISFFSYHWIDLGFNGDVARLVARASRVPLLLIQGDHEPTDYSVAQRMSWASHRTTTRLEDQAYCLLGLFGVNMPLLYGERDAAFIRLQEEIMRSSADLSILAWDHSGHEYMTERNGYLLAHSPALFSISTCVRARGPSTFSLTNRGLRLRIRVARTRAFGGHLLVTNCYDTRYPAYDLGLSVSKDTNRYTALEGSAVSYFVNGPPRLHLVTRISGTRMSEVILPREQAGQSQYANQTDIQLNLIIEPRPLSDPLYSSIRLEQAEPQDRWDSEACSYHLPAPRSQDSELLDPINCLLMFSVYKAPVSAEYSTASRQYPNWTVEMAIEVSSLRESGGIKFAWLQMTRHDLEHAASVDNELQHIAGRGRLCEACYPQGSARLTQFQTCRLVHQRQGVLVFTGLRDAPVEVTFKISRESEHVASFTVAERRSLQRRQDTYWSQLRAIWDQEDLWAEHNRLQASMIRLADFLIMTWELIETWAGASDDKPQSDARTDTSQQDHAPAEPAAVRSTAVSCIRHFVFSVIQTVLYLALIPFLLCGACWRWGLLPTSELLTPMLKRLPKPYRLVGYIKRLRLWGAGTMLRSTDLGGWLVEQEGVELSQ